LAVRGVRIAPGAIAFTRMRLAAYPTASERVSETIPPLAQA